MHSHAVYAHSVPMVTDLIKTGVRNDNGVDPPSTFVHNQWHMIGRILCSHNNEIPRKLIWEMHQVQCHFSLPCLPILYDLST